MIDFAKRMLHGVVPQPVLASIHRNLKYGLPDLADAILGRRDPLVPPRSLDFVGGGDFKGPGDEFLRHFIELGGLTADAAVLDVGCGIGRMARPLAVYLSPSARYEGFDIDLRGIEWCEKNYSRYAHFKFQRADIYNKMYNPDGKQESSRYRFPYPDNSFDFTFSTSVFTHMFPQDVANYLAEISRVLKPGGRTLNTFFLGNEESRALVAAGKSALDMCHEMDGFVTTQPLVPEHAISLEEGFVAGLHEQSGLKVERTAYGSWCGRGEFLSYQDIVVAQKLPRV